ncbi:MAG: ankyrin repeat domain-containing protein [Legionella sp.]|jgi:ankyrin repeat protein
MTLYEFLTIKSQIETSYKLKFLLQAQKEIAYIRAKEQTNIELQKLFNLKPRLFKVRFSEIFESGFIYFAEEITDKQIGEIAELLKKHSINVTRNQSANPKTRGIKLNCTPQKIIQLLSKVQNNTASSLTALPAFDVQQKALLSQFESSDYFRPNKSPYVNDNASPGKLEERIHFYDDNGKNFNGLNEEISQVIERAVMEHNPKLLGEFFGEKAFQIRSNNLELKQATEDYQSGKICYSKYCIKFFSIHYLTLALHWACFKGSLPITKYLFEKHGFDANFNKSFSGLEHHLPTKEPLIGTPLILAAKSGNLNVVRYIYENTEATIQINTFSFTALAAAITLGHEEIVNYLLQKGANPNADEYDISSPLNSAIKCGHQKIIQLLINAGAVVSSEKVNLAIRSGADIKIIELLLQHSIDSENLKKPYLITAIKSGNVSLLQILETHPMISTFNDILVYNEEPIDTKLVKAAAKSGNVAMMKYLVTVKNIDLCRIVLQENIEEEKELIKCTQDNNAQQLLKNHLRFSILKTAVKTNSIPLIQYLFEELNLKPSKIVLENICSSQNNLQMNAYILSCIEQNSEQAKDYRTIALERLSLSFLFKIFTSPLILRGNPHINRTPNLSHFKSEFFQVVGSMIEQLENKLSIVNVLQLIENDPEAAKGALFYFCGNKFNGRSEKLAFLLQRLVGSSNLFKSIDIQNSNGESLAFSACEQLADQITKMLFARGANPDLPDNEGMTVLNLILYGSDYGWIQPYITHITNSLHYANSQYNEKQLALLSQLSNEPTQSTSSPGANSIFAPKNKPIAFCLDNHKSKAQDETLLFKTSL